MTTTMTSSSSSSSLLTSSSSSNNATTATSNDNNVCNNNNNNRRNTVVSSFFYPFCSFKNFSSWKQRHHQRRSIVLTITLSFAIMTTVFFVLSMILLRDGDGENEDEEDYDGIGGGIGGGKIMERNLFSYFNTQQRQQQGRRQLYHEEHKHLYPLDKSDKYGFFFATLGLMVAAGGGIGGGGVLVPVYILVMGFAPKLAIPLSNVTVLGGAFANTILNSMKRHPLANRPLVDWDLILIMEPLTIGGALIGAFLNKLLPEKVLVLLLVLLLSFTSWKTLTKACKMYRKETIALKSEGGVGGGGGDGGHGAGGESELTKLVHDEESEVQCEAGESLLDHMENGGDDDDDNDDDERDSGTSSGNDDDNNNKKNNKNKDDKNDNTGQVKKQKVVHEKLHKILEEESHVPYGNIVVLVSMFVIVLFINLIKGGGAFPSPLGIQCGSPSFWIANIIMLLWILFISYLIRIYLVQRNVEKLSVSYPFVEGDIQWDSRSTLIYPFICCLAGFFAGMFGVGGGIVKGPLMLAMGIHPAVSSASSACMILFTSFTATTSFVVFGLLVQDYAKVCFIIGFVSTLVGQLGLSWLMRRYKRNSYIAFSIGVIVLLSAFLMTVQALVSIAESDGGGSGSGSGEGGGICGPGTKGH